MSLATLNININANANVAVSEFGKVQVAAKDSMGKSSESVDGLRESMMAASRGAEQSMRSMSRSMNVARDATTSSMGTSVDSVDQLSASVLAASQSMEKAAASIQQSMTASGRSIDQAMTASEDSVNGLKDAAGVALGAVAAETLSMGEKIKKTLKDVFGTAFDVASSALKTFLAVEAISYFSDALANVAKRLLYVYAIYKSIKEVAGFAVGLLTGESYKSASIDALIAVNEKVKELQGTLHVTAQEAMATDAALENLGVSKSDYTSVYVKASEAIHNNGEEMDRLGVKYGTTEEIIRNANEKLNEYTEGWDRNQAAAAMGLGTAAQVAAAAKVTGSEIDKAKARLDDYNLGMGVETQVAVKRYEDAMRAFNRETDLTAQGFSRAWADQIMPVFSDLSEALNGGLPYAVNAVRYSMATITSLFYGLKTVVYMVAESILGSISAIGSGLGGLATAAMKALTGDFSGAKSALVQGWDDAKKRLGSIGDNIVEQARRNSAAMRQAWAMDDRAGAGPAKPKGKDWIAKPDVPDDPAKEKKSAQVAAEISDYEKLMKAINEKISIQELEIAGDHTLTDGEKMAAKFATDLRDNKLSLIATSEKSVDMQKIELAAGLEKLIQDERATEAKKAAIKMADEMASAGQKEIKALEDQIKAQKDHNDEIGLPVEQLGALKSTKLDAAAASDEELAANVRLAAAYAGPLHDAYMQYADDLERTAKLSRDLAAGERDGATKQAAADTAKKQADEWKKAVDQYDDVFRKGFANMVNGGKGEWKSFTTSLVTTFKTSVADQLYKMFAQPFVVKMVGSMLGITGGGMSDMAQAASASAGGGGSAIGAVSLLQTAKGAYTAITSGFSGLSSSVAEGVQSGLNMLGTNTGFYSSATSGMPVSSLASSVGTAAGYAGGIAAGKVIGSTISGQYGIGGHGSAVVNVGTAVGAFFGGPIGGAIGGAIGGLLNRAFGMGSKDVTARGISGSLGPSGFSGQAYSTWHQDGGWFRSDKNGIDRTAVDAATSQALGDGYKALQTATAGFVKTLGVNADSIASRTQALNIAIGADATANQKAITDFFVGVGDTMAKELVPSLDQFALSGESASGTLQRIATDYQVVDSVLATMGKSSVLAFGEVGLASVAARERLIAAAGGLDALASGTAYFAQNFMTPAEQMAPIISNVRAQLSAIGAAGVTTNEQFKQLVMGINLSSDAGAKQYAALLQLAPQFKQMTDYMKESSEALSQRADLQNQLDESMLTSTQLMAKQRTALDASNRGLWDQVQAAKAAKAAQDSAKSALQGVVDKTQSYVTSLRSLRAGLPLGSLSTLTPAQKYAESKAQYERTLAAAKGGDAAAQGNFQSAVDAFLTASQLVNASSDKYAADYASVMQTTDDTIKWAQAQVDIGQATLASFDKQVLGIADVNANLLTIAQAVRDLQGTTGVSIVGLNGSHAGGLDRVPFDGYRAELHRDEVVVDAPAAAAMRRYFGAAPSQGGGNTAALVAEIKALREEVKGLRADQEKQTGAIISTNYDATDRAAGKAAEGAKEAAKTTVWAQQSKATLE